MISDWAATQWIAGYAALVATGTLLWNIYKDGFRDRARLSVYPAIMETFGQGTEEHDILAIRITNHGGKPVYVTHVCAQGQGTTAFIVADPELPKKLDQGQYHISLCRHYESLSKGFSRIYVIDSLGREYDASKAHVGKLRNDIRNLASKGITETWSGKRK